MAATLVVALALAGCGGGHSSDTTGPSASTAGAATATGFDFGANNQRTIVAFGDSITFGTLEEKKRVVGKLATSNNYPNILQAMLQPFDPAWRVINRGLPGETTARGVGRIAGVLAADRPGYILIMEGTNDASQDAQVPEIEANLQSMVNQALANKTIPVLATIPPNFRNDLGARDILDEVNSLTRGFVAARGIAFADIFTGMNDRNLFGLAPNRDPLHPNEQGYQVMTNIWFTTLKGILPGGGTAAALRARPPQKKR